MKVLDVNPFHEGLQQNISMLNHLEGEMSAIEMAVEGLVVMEDSLKGQGGDAIRTFYNECHLPFLRYFKAFKSNFERTLKEMDAALDGLEPDQNGFIREDFLEGDIENGLSEISQLTRSLTDEANDIMNQVADIVSLPNLDDSAVQKAILEARRKRDQTVVDLNEFDANQTRALVTIESDLHTMATWISDIEGLFTDGVTAIDFPMEKWMDLTAQNMLKTDLAQYTAEMDGIVGVTGLDGQPATMLGADTDGGKAIMYPQGFGNGPSDLYGAGAYTLPGMASQASPLRNAGVSGATVLGNSAVITSSGKNVSGKVTSAPTTDVKKPEKKKKGNKVLGFLKGAADFLILDDIKMIADPNTSLLNKGFAIFAVTPAGKGLKAARLGFKLVRKSPFGVGPVKIKGTGKRTKKLEVQDFTKEVLEKKPMNSPIPKKWYKKGGSISIDGKGDWTYKNKTGQSVEYPNGYPDFTPYKHPNVEPVKIKVQSPKNNPKDFENANIEARLTKDTNPPIFDIKKPAEGYTWHHHQDGKTMMLVDEDIHREFRHIGGQSKINGKNK